jgi:hypothetical protein
MDTGSRSGGDIRISGQWIDACCDAAPVEDPAGGDHRDGRHGNDDLDKSGKPGLCARSHGRYR